MPYSNHCRFLTKVYRQAWVHVVLLRALGVLIIVVAMILFKLSRHSLHAANLETRHFDLRELTGSSPLSQSG